jgi:hypothetical protein
MSDRDLPPQPEQPAGPPPPAAGSYIPGNLDAAPPAPEPQPRGRRRLLLLLAGLLGGFVACAAIGLALLVLLTPTLRSRIAFLNPTAGAPPEAPNKFVDTGTGPVSIVDDFAADTRRWDRSTTAVVNGAYELTLELDNFDSYGLFLGGDGIADFDLAVDATLTAGPPDAEYGIRFRQSAPDEHLIFSISPSGFYRLARVSDETYSSLVPWTRDARIVTGVGGTNRLRVVAEGPTITGYINGEQVLTYQDEQQNPGQLTLGLVTFDQGGLTVRFDNAEGFALAQLADGTPTRLEIAESFDDPALVPWSVGGATLRSQAYEFFVGGSFLSWQQPLPTGSSEVSGDFVLEVDATIVDGNVGESGDISGYGLMFGDDGAFNFFALVIIPQGGVTLYRSGDDAGAIIPPIPLATINPGLDATNRLRVEVRDNVITLSVNDQPITFDGQDLSSIPLPEGFSADGMAGVFLQGDSAGDLRVRFDNFRLEETP